MLLSELSHERIVSYTGHIVGDNRLYIFLEYMEGVSSLRQGHVGVI